MNDSGSPTIYGIKNCDTMKKAFAWLDANGIAYRFHDYRKSGVDAATLERWCDKLGWQTLVNTRGTTWRRLDEREKAIADERGAVALMAAHPSLIRRPVVETASGEILAGFDPARFAVAFGIHGASA